MEVKPTRSELIQLKKQIILAQQGKELLEKKQDALFLEFLKLKDKAMNAYSRLAATARFAAYCLAMAQAYDGTVALKSAALTAKPQLTVLLKKQNILGVKVPKISSRYKRLDLLERGFSFLNVSSHIDEAIEAYEEYVQAIVELAAVESQLKKLVKEITKTRRRRNALEQVVLPQLKANASQITHALDERGREEVFRLKRLKKKILVRQ